MNSIPKIALALIVLLPASNARHSPFTAQNKTDVWLDVSLGGRSSTCGRTDIHGLNPGEQRTVKIPGRHGQSSDACCLGSLDVHWDWSFERRKWDNKKHFSFSGASGCWDDMHLELSWLRDKEGNIIHDAQGNPTLMLKSWGISKLS